MMTSKPVNVFFIALDSGDYPTIQQWCAEGRLPVINRLLQKSIRVPSVAPIGVYASALWPSFYSGCNPARHGTTCWRQLVPGTYDLYRHKPGERMVTDTYWQALSRAGKRVATVDVPLSGLDGPVNGIHVVEWGTHNWEIGFQTYPPELADEIHRVIGPSPLGGPSNAWRTTADDFRRLRDILLANIEKKTEMVLHLLDKGPWDLFSVVYGEMHCAGHHGWHLHDPSLAEYRADIVQEIGNPVLDIYQAIDKTIGIIEERIGPEATLAAFFTHGVITKFGASYMMDEFCRRWEAAKRHRLDMTIAKLIDLLVKRGVKPLTALRNRTTQALGDKLINKAATLTPADCAVFYVPNNNAEAAFRVNMVGREPNGKVRTHRERTRVLTALRKALLELKDTETGELIVEDVFDLRERYKGPLAETMPDFALIWKNHPVSCSIHSPATGTIDNVPSDSCRIGDHTPYGCLTVSGPGWTPGDVPRQIECMDVMPTVCSWLGVDWKEADGQPASELRRS